MARHRHQPGSISLKWAFVWIVIFVLTIWFLTEFATAYLPFIYSNQIFYIVYIGTGISVVAAIIRNVTFHAQVVPRDFIIFLCTHIFAFWFFNLLATMIGIPHAIFYYIFTAIGVYVVAQIVRRM